MAVWSIVAGGHTADVYVSLLLDDETVTGPCLRRGDGGLSDVALAKAAGRTALDIAVRSASLIAVAPAQAGALGCIVRA